jgi:chorismate lyase / 3-hydroxybenzoate synthase
VPAYSYPPEHGPRPPSFARATVVPREVAGRADVFISGTAAIRGHATVAPDATLPQLACTLENLREIAAACGIGPDLARGRARARHFKIYLRRAGDLVAVQPVLERELLLPTDTAIYLRSDICRRELNVEIEATLLGAERNG